MVNRISISEKYPYLKTWGLGPKNKFWTILDYFFPETLKYLVSSRGGGVNLLPNFQQKKGGLTVPQLWERVAGKEGGDFFQGEVRILQKTKLKSEIFIDQKSL